MTKGHTQNNESEYETIASNIVILIIPCLNEESRWDADYWAKVSQIPNLKLCFVNDGSTDGTSSRIHPLLFNSKHLLLELPTNFGKAEAIRRGFAQVFKETPLGIGFLDADGAFPIADIEKQIQVFRQLTKSNLTPIAVWSSRVQLAGRSIERDLRRHYLARIIVTILAWRLNFKIYDTQSGMKIFTFSPALESCMKEPYKTRWFVDLEIFMRWREDCGTEMEIWEEPLLGWKDIGGSKLSGRQYLAVLHDILWLNSYARKIRKASN